MTVVVCPAKTTMNANAVDSTRLEQTVKALSSADSLRRPLASINDVRSIVAASDTIKLKTLLRSNAWPVEHEARRTLWRLLAYGPQPQSDGVFKEYVHKLFPASDSSDDNGNNMATEDLDCSKTIVNPEEDLQPQYFLSPSGMRSARRILCVLGETNPHIGDFSFLLYAFTSLLLHYLPEEDCFDSIYALVKSKTTDYFLTPSELSLRASAHVLCELAYRYAKPTAVYLERLCIDGNLHNLCGDWLLWLFKYLPFSYLVRIIDCYLVEGFKVLYRMALSLMTLYHRTNLKPTSVVNGSKVDFNMKRFCLTIDKVVSVDRLLQIGFAIRGFTRKQVTKLFIKNEQFLRHPVAISGNGFYTDSTGGVTGTVSASVVEDSKNVVCRGSSILEKVSKKHQSFKFDHAIYSHIDLKALSSTILDKVMLAKVWTWLPELQAVRDPQLVFTTEEHGYSIKRFYEHSEGQGPTLLLIRTIAGEIFGAYCSTDWHERQRSIDAGAQICYFGTGESFVFTLEPDAHCYRWVGCCTAADGSGDVVMPKATAHMFMAADNSMFMVGGGGGGEALQIDENLDHGHSSRCDTFENAPLCSPSAGGSGQFQVQTLEVIAFH